MSRVCVCLRRSNLHEIKVDERWEKLFTKSDPTMSEKPINTLSDTEKGWWGWQIPCLNIYCSFGKCRSETNFCDSSHNFIMSLVTQWREKAGGREARQVWNICDVWKLFTVCWVYYYFMSYFLSRRTPHWGRSFSKSFSQHHQVFQLNYLPNGPSNTLKVINRSDFLGW